jgi:hypothetical protein
MMRFILNAILCLAFAFASAAQQSPADRPATKEDIEQYLKVMHSHEMMAQTVTAMSKPIHQMIHEQFLKDKDKLPADFEARMNKEMDDTMKSFPWDEMLDAMVPVYQKHFTKGDVDALVAFYGTPTGQKILRELPSITSEAMQSMMPLLQKHIAAMNDRIQQEVAEMMKDSDAKSGNKSQSTPN